MLARPLPIFLCSAEPTEPGSEGRAVARLRLRRGATRPPALLGTTRLTRAGATVQSQTGCGSEAGQLWGGGPGRTKTFRPTPAMSPADAEISRGARGPSQASISP